MAAFRVMEPGQVRRRLTPVSVSRALAVVVVAVVVPLAGCAQTQTSASPASPTNSASPIAATQPTTPHPVSPARSFKHVVTAPLPNDAMFTLAYNVIGLPPAKVTQPVEYVETTAAEATYRFGISPFGVVAPSTLVYVVQIRGRHLLSPGEDPGGPMIAITPGALPVVPSPPAEDETSVALVELNLTYLETATDLLSRPMAVSTPVNLARAGEVRKLTWSQVEAGARASG